ncbi:hypothetical protein RNJ44_04934 [Nakaseomyces bracarensis]|uniref:C2H2-type domain-containing protein n=1 Tax=Nakaseomyces bracarensis TaxID=273131 RepID=A0ABR4NWE6_9SACH
MVFEEFRGLLEDIEVIEDSITARIQRNPEIAYDYMDAVSKLDGDLLDEDIINRRKQNMIYRTKKYARSRKQTKTQQYEINVFLDDIFNKNKKVMALRSQLKNEEDKVKDPERNFEFIEQMLKEVETKYLGNESAEDRDLPIDEKVRNYSMFPKKDKLLSERSGVLNITEYFKRDEQFGLVLDLEYLYREWFNVIQNTNDSYLTFVGKMETFLDDEKYLLEPIMDRKNARYCDFLRKACTFIEEVFFKTNILMNKEQSVSKLRRKFIDNITTPHNNEKKGEFCLFCGKWFKTHGVYASHLPGKVHTKNETKFKEVYLAEYKIHVYLKALVLSLQGTKDYLERKMAYTNEERIEDTNRLNENYEQPIYDASVEREEDYEDNTKKDKKGKFEDLTNLLGSSSDMPLGADGLPIPFWLFKMQGLDVNHDCEICGNIQYKGHKQFEKHFTGATHKYHLRCLGIEPSSAFNGITKISEAQALWKQMNSVDGTSLELTELKEEVEDKEGNVMSKDIYAELKKQGLV